MTMSLSISGSKYVKVYNPTIKLSYSNKVLFATLVSSRRTGNAKVNHETGDVIINPETGKEVQERAYSRWDAKFVGNAFEASKGLRDGDSIDIISGWITAEKSVGHDNREYTNVVVTISEFTLSEVGEGDDT